MRKEWNREKNNEVNNNRLKKERKKKRVGYKSIKKDEKLKNKRKE